MVWRDKEKELNDVIKAIKKSNLIRRRDKDTILFIANKLLQENKDLSTIVRYLYIYKVIAELNLKHSLKRLSKEDIAIIYKRYEHSRNSTKRKVERCISLLREFNKKIPELKFNKPKEGKKYFPIIEKDVFYELILPQVIDKYKDFIWLLYDTGARPHEIARIKRDNVRKEGNSYILLVDGKTGPRVLKTVEFKGSIDLSKEYPFGHIKATSFIRYLNKLEKKLKIPLWAYLLRHTKASEYAQYLTDQELKAYFGWTPSSKMLDIYVHLSSEKVIKKLDQLFFSPVVESKSLDTPRPSVAQEGSKEINYIA